MFLCLNSFGVFRRCAIKSEVVVESSTIRERAAPMACENCACGNVAEQLDQVTTPADCMEDEESLRRKALKATGAQLIHGDGVHGIRVGGWAIQTRKAPILKMAPREKLVFRNPTFVMISSRE